MIKHDWESHVRGKRWQSHVRGGLQGLRARILKRATGPTTPPSDDLLRDIDILVDCDEEKVRQVMES